MLALRQGVCWTALHSIIKPASNTVFTSLHIMIAPVWIKMALQQMLYFAQIKHQNVLVLEQCSLIGPTGTSYIVQQSEQAQLAQSFCL